MSIGKFVVHPSFFSLKDVVLYWLHGRCMNELKKERKKRQEFQLCFGDHLKKFRKLRGITGAELARRCYMDKPNLTRLEKEAVSKVETAFLFTERSDVFKK